MKTFFFLILILKTRSGEEIKEGIFFFQLDD